MLHVHFWKNLMSRASIDHVQTGSRDHILVITIRSILIQFSCIENTSILKPNIEILFELETFILCFKNFVLNK